jgi:hypothetical protein
MNAFFEHHKDSIEFGTGASTGFCGTGSFNRFRSPNGYWASSTRTATADA